jgi:hypothetical protein
MTDNAAAWRGATFRVSSFSGSSGGNCVEVALTGTRFGVRDSKMAESPVLAVDIEHGRAFLTALKHDRVTVL